jgi:hypothetical protein
MPVLEDPYGVPEDTPEWLSPESDNPLEQYDIPTPDSTPSSGGGGPPEDLGIAGGAPPAAPKVDEFLQRILSSGLPPAVIEEIVKSYKGQQEAALPQVDIETETEERMREEERKLAPPGFAPVAPTPKPFENAAMQIAQLAQSMIPTFRSQARSPMAGGENPYEAQNNELSDLMGYLFGRRRRTARTMDYSQPAYNDPYKLLGGV